MPKGEVRYPPHLEKRLKNAIGFIYKEVTDIAYELGQHQNNMDPNFLIISSHVAAEVVIRDLIELIQKHNVEFAITMANKKEQDPQGHIAG
jgi:hypothetical protein